MLFWIYWAMCLALCALIIDNLFREKKGRAQLVAALVLIPVLLRVLLIK